MNYKVATNIDFNFFKILIILVTKKRLNYDFNEYNIKKKINRRDIVLLSLEQFKFHESI